MPLLPLERRGAQTPPDGPPPSERFNLDSNLRRWFARNLGLWRSRRQYIFQHDEVLYLDMVIRVEIFAESAVGVPRYRFTWWPEKETEAFERKLPYRKEGQMEATLLGHQLQRDRAYLEDMPVRTQIRQVDEHEVVFESDYADWHILEHTRLIDQDRYRSRAIYSWKNGELAIVEHHHETRMEDATEPISA